MLVLSRKPSEEIVLQNIRTKEVITLTVVRIGPNSVRLGTDAGDEWDIFRPEQYPDWTPTSGLTRDEMDGIEQGQGRYQREQG